MVITYERKQNNVLVNGNLISGGLIEALQWDQGIACWQAAIQITHPEVIVNDEVESMCGVLDNKSRIDFHIDEETLEIESVQIYI